MSISVNSISDELIRRLGEIFPRLVTPSLVDGALGVTEPHRNHSRAEIARLARGLICARCSSDHVPGCVSCGGSGLSTLGNSIYNAKEA